VARRAFWNNQLEGAQVLTATKCGYVEVSGICRIDVGRSSRLRYQAIEDLSERYARALVTKRANRSDADGELYKMHGANVVSFDRRDYSTKLRENAQRTLAGRGPSVRAAQCP